MSGPGARPVSRLCVVGLGHLGAPIAACLASRGGYTVHGADVSPAVVDSVNRGVAPVFEPGLEEMLAGTEGRLSATTDLGAAVSESDITFVVVPTPSDGSGFSLRHVADACEQIGTALTRAASYHVVVITSTVMPGATGGAVREALERTSGKRCGTDFGLCYSPEFIALGSVIRDFLNPGFLLIGESDSDAGDALETIYKKVCESDPPSARMSLVNAEIAKISVNTFVTTKISFANMLARICERLLGADVDVVTAAVGLDPRIGRAYLRGGIGYGGPCFPRDNVALATLARSLGAPADIAEATDGFNRKQVEFLAELSTDNLAANGTVGILGLTYKPNTDVVEESPGLLLLQALDAKGVPVVAYDPAANPRAVGASGVRHRVVGSAEECVRRSDLVVVATAWPEFSELPKAVWERDDGTVVVIDCWRTLDHLSDDPRVNYLTLGRGGMTSASGDAVSDGRVGAGRP